MLHVLGYGNSNKNHYQYLQFLGISSYQHTLAIYPHKHKRLCTHTEKMQASSSQALRAFPHGTESGSLGPSAVSRLAQSYSSPDPASGQVGLWRQLQTRGLSLLLKMQGLYTSAQQQSAFCHNTTFTGTFWLTARHKKRLTDKSYPITK